MHLQKSVVNTTPTIEIVKEGEVETWNFKPNLFDL